MAYWQDRLLVARRDFWKHASGADSDLAKFYRAARADMERDIAAIYGKFAVDNKISLADAQAILNRVELRDFQRRIERYKEIWKSTGDTRALAEYSKMATRSRITRIESLKADIDARLTSMTADVNDRMEKHLSTMHRNGYNRNIYELQNASGRYTGNFARVNDRAIKASIETPWSGDNFSGLVWKQKEQIVDAVRRSVLRAAAQGRPLQEVARDLNKVTGAGYKNSLRLIRTETAAVSSRIELEIYDELKVEKYRFVAAGDSCPECLALEAETAAKPIPVSDGVPGVNMEPLHPNCTCTTVPDIEVEDLKRWTRGGSKESMTYPEWLEYVRENEQ